ncbi:MAG TPA: ATP-binding protein [Crocinitomicaceae bacterium]|nr:ATP-binding protein [Crocinitomicaceae bacterium]
MQFIERNNYLERLISLRETEVIKVVTGIRRCGKSTLFRLYIDYLKKKGVSEDAILWYNFEDFALQSYIDNPQKLHDEITEIAKTGKMLYVFLDEVQNLKNFERIVDSLNLRSNIDLYITGSNSFLLSGELATLLTGRYVETHVLPFSFKEYVEMHKDRSRLDLFNDYLQNGGFPGAIAIPELVRADYVRGIYNSIMQKDIMTRNAWRKTDHFDRIVRFMFDSIGSPMSAHNISKVFKNLNFSISAPTVENYLDAVCDAYLFYKVQRYNIKGKVILSTQEKFYAADLGLKNIVLGQTSQNDTGHALENLVYLELLRRGNQINIGKADDTEIDFVIQTPQGEREYIQVAWTAKEQSTFEREIRPFEKIKDYNKRILLTTDVEPITSYKGIQKINVIDWLLAD